MRITIVLAMFAIVFGWVANLFQFFGMLDGGLTAMFFARAIGIFVFPLGAVLGYF